MYYKTLFNKNSTYHQEDCKPYMTEQQFKKAFILIREHTIREVVKDCRVQGSIIIDEDKDLLITQDRIQIEFNLLSYEEYES